MVLKAAVIGTGMMGRNHVRVYAQMEGRASLQLPTAMHARWRALPACTK